MKALNTWTRNSIPDNPGAWLYRVAYNAVIARLRTDSNQQALLAKLGEVDAAPRAHLPEATFSQEIQDNMVRMLFVCCDERLPQ